MRQDKILFELIPLTGLARSLSHSFPEVIQNCQLNLFHGARENKQGIRKRESENKIGVSFPGDASLVEY